MKGIKRFSSGLLAALIVISMLPMAAVESSAAVSAPSSATVLAQRMNAVKSGTYGVGKYFTTNGTACVGHNRCKTPTAAEAGVAGAKQCFGYARYVFYQLFGLSLSTQYYGSKRYELADLGNIKQVGQRASSTVSATATKEILTKAYMGDVIQASQTPTTKQHTMIVNSVSSTGVTVLECNWDDVCDIDLRTISWSNFAKRFPYFTLYRSKNHPGQTSSTAYKVGQYKVTTSAGLNIRSKASTSGTNLGAVPYNKTVSVTKISSNWGYITYNGISGWICLDYTSYVGALPHTHNYSGQRVYEVEHPHRISERCVDYDTCGGFRWTDEYYKLRTCEKCWDVVFKSSVSSLAVKVGGSTNLTIWMDGSIYPEGGKVYYDYDQSIIEVVQNSAREYTIKGKKAGSCNLVFAAYTDASKSKVITKMTIPVTVSANTYTITYNANGGTGAPSSQTKTYGKTLTLSSTKPTRTGYTFQGWSTSSTASSAAYQPGGSFTSNANTTLYAVWKANTYTVTYNANGGTGAPSNQTKTYGKTLTLSSTKPTRTGYTFQGWSTSSTASSATYQPGGSFTSNANTTLYAVWKANTYTVTYNANGGTGAPSSQTKTYGKTLTLSSTKPTRTGYTFQGWSTSSTAGSATYQPGGSFTSNANTTLYAVWKKDTVVTTATIRMENDIASTGGKIQVPVYVEKTDLGVLSLSFSYDSSKLRFVSCDNTAFDMVELDTSTAGKVKLVAADSSSVPAGIVAVLTFEVTAVSPCTTEIKMTVDEAYDGNDNAITLEVQNCTLTITDKKTGDVNGDGKLSAIDARFALQSAAGNRELTTQAAKAADVNGDGKVTAIDARWILQAAAGNRVL